MYVGNKLERLLQLAKLESSGAKNKKKKNWKAMIKIILIHYIAVYEIRVCRNTTKAKLYRIF